MKKCNKCGNMNQDDFMFCESCGNVLSGESYTETETPRTAPTPPTVKRRKISPKMMAGIAIVVCVFIVIAFSINTLFVNSPSNFDDDGKITTNGIAYWDIGKDSTLRYSFEGSISGHYKMIVTNSSDTDFDYEYNKRVITSSSDSTEISTKHCVREDLKTRASTVIKTYEGHECYVITNGNSTSYVGVNDGITWLIDYDDHAGYHYKQKLVACNFKPM